MQHHYAASFISFIHIRMSIFASFIMVICYAPLLGLYVHTSEWENFRKNLLKWSSWILDFRTFYVTELAWLLLCSIFMELTLQIVENFNISNSLSYWQTDILLLGIKAVRFCSSYLIWLRTFISHIHVRQYLYLLTLYSRV